MQIDSANEERLGTIFEKLHFHREDKRRQNYTLGFLWYRSPSNNDHNADDDDNDDDNVDINNDVVSDKDDDDDIVNV